MSRFSTFVSPNKLVARSATGPAPAAGTARRRILGFSLTALMLAAVAPGAWSVPLKNSGPGVFFGLEADYRVDDRPGGAIINVLDEDAVSVANSVSSLPVSTALPFTPTANPTFTSTPFGDIEFDAKGRIENSLDQNLQRTQIEIGVSTSSKVSADIVGGDFDGPEWEFVSAVSSATVELRDQIEIVGPHVAAFAGLQGQIDMSILAEGGVTAFVEALEEVVVVPGVGVFTPRFGSFQAVADYTLDFTVVNITLGTETVLLSLSDTVVVEQQPNGEQKTTVVRGQAFNALSATLPFTFGDPFDYAIQVTATANAAVLAADGGKPEFTLENDFLGTFTLTDFDVFDPNGIAIDDFGVQSAAGLTYPGVAAATAQAPAPATLGLCLLGLAFLGRSRTRRNPAA